MKKRSLLFAAVLCLAVLIPCVVVLTRGTDPASESADTETGLQLEGSMALSYADQFSIAYYEGGYALIDIVDGGRFLVVPDGMAAPDGLDEDIVILQQPLDHIYLVATSAMDLFRALDGIDHIRLSGTDASGWYIEEAVEAFESGSLLYAGKYSAPDYELILEEACDLAVESTMILHTPEVKEQLEAFGIPVLVEHSSYESHPLGRLEWIRLYGVLLGKTEEAEAFFADAVAKVDAVAAEEGSGKSVAFFYITSNGAANVRKSADYVAKMIEMAGGTYLFDDLGDDTALSTVNLQMETFYAQAKDADILIYNSTIDGELDSLDALLEKSALLQDFTAVQTGNVWCTGQNMFQKTTAIADMIVELHSIINDADVDESSLTYFYRLQ